MKPFLRKFLQFGIVVVVLAFLLQTVVTFRTRKLFVTRKGILESTDGVNADLVLLGSSRCFMQLDTQFFDTCFHLRTVNLGVNGHSELSMTVIRLQRYLVCNAAPRFAILAFDAYTRAGSVTHNDHIRLKDQFARYAYFPDKLNRPLLNYFGFSWKERYIPLYTSFKYNLIDHFFSGTDLTNHQELGSEIYDENWDTVANPVMFEKPLSSEKDRLEVKEALKTLEDVCSAHHIRLLCLQTPAFRSFYDPVAFSAAGRTCRELQLPFVDTNKDSLIRDVHLFYNALHVNKKGIAMMEDLICRDTTMRAFFGMK